MFEHLNDACQHLSKTGPPVRGKPSHHYNAYNDIEEARVKGDEIVKEIISLSVFVEHSVTKRRHAQWDEIIQRAEEELRATIKNYNHAKEQEALKSAEAMLYLLGRELSAVLVGFGTLCHVSDNRRALPECIKSIAEQAFADNGHTSELCLGIQCDEQNLRVENQSKPNLPVLHSLSTFQALMVLY